jgi:hypothetical protein
MKKWEYKLVRPDESFKKAPKLEQFLNKQGADGWELCAILTMTAIFKRERSKIMYFLRGK